MKLFSVSTLRALLPVLLLVGVGVWMSREERAEQGRTSGAAGPSRAGSLGEELLLKENFQEVSLGALPPGWEAPRGTFAVASETVGKVLVMTAEPMVEGRVLLPRLLPGGGMVRARMRGEAGKRAFPRFGVGLAQDTVFKLLARPGEGQLQLVEIRSEEVNGNQVENDQVLASVPWQWQSQSWWWVEISVQATADGTGSAWSGRCWAEGTTRPADPMLTFVSPTPPKLVRASLNVAPYALKPIWIDRVEMSGR